MIGGIIGSDGVYRPTRFGSSRPTFGQFGL
jgi:hypothetical protein